MLVASQDRSEAMGQFDDDRKPADFASAGGRSAAEVSRQGLALPRAKGHEIPLPRRLGV